MWEVSTKKIRAQNKAEILRWHPFSLEELGWRNVMEVEMGETDLWRCSRMLPDGARGTIAHSAAPIMVVMDFHTVIF
jgi:hypothetical protein